MSAIGMMDGAFFVGRKEIVDWVNDTLNVNISKVKISILLILIN
jgi:RP/EB family microtubule-associated protein